MKTPAGTVTCAMRRKSCTTIVYVASLIPPATAGGERQSRGDDSPGIIRALLPAWVPFKICSELVAASRG